LPKKTTEVIIDSKNDYVIGVKKNQPTLYHQLETILSDRQNHSSSYITMERNRGRIELRNVMVSNFIDPISKDWKGVQQIVAVHRIVTCKGKRSEEMAYFISSRNESACFHMEAIRSHWQIENSLHYVKDVTQKEDASKIRTGNAPTIISTIRNIAINLFRKNNYTNIAEAMRLVCNDIQMLYKLTI
jgi:predicted transposase YbfD/YdcC